MNALITPDELASRVCSGGVLYSITLGKFGTEKLDKQASAKARADAGITDKKSARVYKTLVNAQVIEMIKKLDAYIRTIPKKYGAPWGPNIWFIPASRYIELTREIKVKLDERNELVKRVADEYNIAREEAKTRLGTMFNDDDFPSVAHVVSKFTQETRTAQITSPNGSMLGIFGDIASAVMSDVQETFNDQIGSMVPYIKEVLLTPLVAMSASLQNVNAIYRDTLFTNVWDASEQARGLNVVQDEEINGAIHEIDNCLRRQPETCRESKTARSMVAADCGRIIEHLGGTIPAPAPDSKKVKVEESVTLSPCNSVEVELEKAREILSRPYADAEVNALMDTLPDPPAVIQLDEQIFASPRSWANPSTIFEAEEINEPTDEQIHSVADMASAVSDPAEREEALIENALGEDILAKLGW